MFTVVRIYSDEKGDSHFEEITVPLKENGMVGACLPELQRRKLYFVKSEPTYDWENQNIILLTEIEITTLIKEK